MQHTEVKQKFLNIENLVFLDFQEAFAAMCMCDDFQNHMFAYDLLEKDLQRGIGTIHRALCINFLLSTQRLLQGGRKQTLFNLLLSAKSLVSCETYEKFWLDFERIRNGEAAKNLHNCRNAFMAHTHGDTDSLNIRKNGIKDINTVGELLINMASLVEALHTSVFGINSTINIYQKFDEYNGNIALKTWNFVMRVEDAV